MELCLRRRTEACALELDPDIDLVRCRGAQGKRSRPATHCVWLANGRRTPRLISSWPRYSVWNGYRIYGPLRHHDGVHPDVTGWHELQADTRVSHDQSSTQVRRVRPHR